MSVAVRLLQLTDCHLKASPEGLVKGWPTRRSLDVAVEAALARFDGLPDAILATGDISQDGSAESYDHFRDRLAGLGVPVLCIPGNHDDPGTMAAACSGPPFSFCGDAAFGDWRIVLLSTWDGDRGGGRLGTRELERLGATLAAAREGHALVVLHHHPLPVGSRWLDGVALDDAARFLEVVDAADRVRGVLWGHVHQVFDDRRNGVRYLGTPSTCFQFRPHTDVPEIDEPGPAWRVLELHPDGTIRTDVGWAPWRPE